MEALNPLLRHILFCLGQRSSFLQDQTVKPNKMTPNCKQLYKASIKVKNQLSRNRSKINTFKHRVKLADKFMKEDHFSQIVDKVNSSTYNFILSQLKNQKKKLHGRRYSKDDKILALSIYKQSPKGYKYLSSLFALPSVKTIMSLLRKVPLGPGINGHIFEHLKKIVEKLSPMDRYCTIMFDEMALEAGLQYDKHKDCVFGLEDFGNYRRKPIFADHVLTFMIRGTHKKYKQPICFYFIKGTTKSQELVRCIKEVILNVLNTGLNIVATVSDQGMTNIAAINFLMEETRQHCLKENIDNILYEGYLINGHEIIHIYDPPHLLKSIRNNLLTKDVNFTWRGKRQTATWDHLVNLYEIDKKYEHLEMRCLPKITEAHIYKEKIKKMKVSYASQIFSHKVASTMRLMSDMGKHMTTHK